MSDKEAVIVKAIKINIIFFRIVIFSAKIQFFRDIKECFIHLCFYRFLNRMLVCGSRSFHFFDFVKINAVFIIA
jgi:hypothetical protein